MTAIRNIPEELKEHYSLNNQISIVDWYFNNDGNKNKYYSKEQINLLVDVVKSGKLIKTSYQNTDPFLYESLRKYDINNKDVLIIGSEQPSYECICLAFGGNPTILDYNKVNTDHEKVKTYSVFEFYSTVKNKYDIIFSISSFEHDGLGRYGDPLNPYGDFDSMKRMKVLLKDEGFLFLAVPVGVDTLFWNAARWYGKIRLPMLMDGWKVIDSFGFEEKMFLENYNPGQSYNQPVFVLQKI